MTSIVSLRADADRVGVELARLKAALQPRPPALDLAVWSQERLGFTNPPFILEWCELAVRTPRLCVLAPRDHGKSQVFAVNQVAWRSVEQPGHFTYVFSATADQAASILKRVADAVAQADPTLRQRVANSMEASWSNGSRVKVAGAGKSVRGDHPDLIVGDDVLDEDATRTKAARRKVESWWLGTVGGMAHPGSVVHLVGTPFHGQDLLMSLKGSAVYTWRRYAAEFQEYELVDGWAVEVGRPQATGTVSVRPEPVMVAPAWALSPNQQARADELEAMGWRSPNEEQELQQLLELTSGTQAAQRMADAAERMAQISNGRR